MNLALAGLAAYRKHGLNAPEAVRASTNEYRQDMDVVGRNHEQIDGRDFRGMVAQKGTPSLTRRSPSLDHVFGHSQLGNLKAELEQLAMNARGSP